MKKHFKEIKQLYAALLIGQFMICLVFIVIHFSDDVPSENAYTFLFLAGIILIGSMTGVRLVTIRKNKEIPGLKDLKQKLAHHRRVSMIRWALIEGANLICLVFMFTMGQLEFLVLFLIGLTVFIFLKPDKAKFLKIYNIDV